MDSRFLLDFRSIITAVSLAGTLVLTGCSSDKPSLIDKTLGLTRSDYKNINKSESRKEAAEKSAKEEGDAKKLPSEPVSEAGSEPPIPDVSPIVSSPPPPKAGDQLMVSLSVTDDVPLRDVLLELARLASVDLEMDGGITGGIIFKAHNRPFSEVIERVAEMAHLRYKLADGILRVQLDTPYVKNYPIDFLNVERSSTSSVTVNTNVLSGGGSSSSGSGSSSSGSSSSSSSSGGGSGNEQFNSGSNSTITSKAESDLWKSFEEGVKQILQDVPVKQESRTQQQDAAKSPTTGQEQQGGGEKPSRQIPKPGTNVQPMQAAIPAGGNASERNAGAETFYVINKQAGVVTIKATDAQHKKILEYIEKLKASASAQVLIEAKIVEVTLDNAFQSGINWQTLFENAGYSIDANFTDFDAATGSNLATFAITQAAGLNLEAAVSLTEQFGTTRTLSSPRLTAINNQQAVLTFAKNQVYFDISIERETNSSSSNNQQLLTVDSDVKTVPIGIILNIQPSIDTANNEVTLNVRPTLSRISDFVDDPAVAFLSSQAGATGTIPPNQIPVVEVREIDSILKIKSGQIMIIGGLMEDKAANTDKGLPGVSTIPVVGNLFKSMNKSDTMSELVIFIKATIVPSRTTVHPYDKELYKKFTSDPRPLNF